MAEREIKHASFVYFVEREESDPRTGDERTRLSRRIALRGQVVDIPRDEDVERGDQTGAFVTEEEVEQREREVEEQAAADESRALDYDDHDQLVAWIRDEKPPAAEVVAAAGDDPDRANKLMDAEEEASGGQPRKSVMEPLQKVAES